MVGIFCCFEESLEDKKRIEMVFQKMLDEKDVSKFMDNIKSVERLKDKCPSLLLIRVGNGLKTILDIFHKNKHKILQIGRFQRKLSKVTRVKKALLGKIAMRINSGKEKASACVPLLSLKAKMFYQTNDQNSRVELTYLECMEKFGEKLSKSDIQNALLDLKTDKLASLKLHLQPEMF